MKHLLTYSLLAVCILITSCSSDRFEEEQTFQKRSAIVTSNTTSQLISNQRSSGITEGYCITTALIAGQNMTAGTVDVSYDGTYLTITYSTTAEWTIGVTHLSIGSCADDPIPTSGSGNPMVGQFEYNDTHPAGTHEVTYLIDASDLDDNYCFAAHAEVHAATSDETAWAEGLDFPGNNWAMYVSSNLSDCPDTSTDDGDTDDGDTGR
ncbi:MAG: hypothetical protein ACI828_000065 [Flavobacteriales bacterium]|jgi:hypothetical protein